MKIEYDQNKNQRNLQIRGLCFEIVVSLDWKMTVIHKDNRKEYGEARMIALCPDQDNNIFNVVFAMRGSVLRIISFRKANVRERKIYEKTK